MAEKYYCPTCGCRYIDWGAEKLDFKCPTEGCEQNTLLLVGSDAGAKIEKPKRKRAAKSKTIVPRSKPQKTTSKKDADLDTDNDTVPADDDDDAVSDADENKPGEPEKE